MNHDMILFKQHVQRCSSSTSIHLVKSESRTKRNVNLSINEQCDYGVVVECKVSAMYRVTRYMFVQQKMMAVVTSDQEREKESK